MAEKTGHPAATGADILTNRFRNARENEKSFTMKHLTLRREVPGERGPHAQRSIGTPDRERQNGKPDAFDRQVLRVRRGVGGKQSEEERRLSASRGAADEDPALADQRRARVNRRRLAHAAGRRTTKRAPRTVGGAPGSLPGRVRFSARMVPRWDSMIC